ncbi:MAG: GNAT family N-acetyltransferase [Acidobacteriia bacterium]|nr:GNAT family N-acetyltransferase [Terriglobia bacterium]
MKFVDTSLARRLEAAEEVPQIEIARVLQRVNPEIGADILAIAGGHAVFAGLNSPVGRAIGLGLDSPVTAAQLDEVEAFYKQHNAPSQVDITPVTHGSLLELLKTRGYVMTELNNVMARRLEPYERFEENALGCEFRACTPEDVQLWTHTMLCGFFPEDQIPAGWDYLLAPMAQVPNALAMLVWVDGKPVACCGGLIVREHRMVMLGGTSTLPAYRGRRIQTAAIGRRLNRAITEGCDLAVVVTLGNTTSQRNAERMGFTLAYSKATVVRK